MNLKTSYFLLLLLPLAQAQQAPLLLTEAYQLAEANYPLLRQKELIGQLSEQNLKVLEAERMPALFLKGESRLQSEAIQIGSDAPNSPISLQLPRESFQVYAEVGYTLYDGGRHRSQQALEQARQEVSQQQLTVSLRSIKERINQLFLAILLYEQQQKLLLTSLEGLESNLQTVSSAFRNGLVLESEVSKLKVRKLELLSEQARQQGEVNALRKQLGYFIGQEVAPTRALQLPETLSPEAELPVERPELNWYQSRKQLLTEQEKSLSVAKRPLISAFAQGGMGYPNPLNFADISTAPYGLVGLRAQWRLWDWNKTTRQAAGIRLQQEMIATEEETFTFELQAHKSVFAEKWNALEQQLANDRQIVALQEEILAQSSAQLREGTLTSNDYLQQVNATLAAKQQLELHKIQQQQLSIEHQTRFGKL